MLKKKNLTIKLKENVNNKIFLPSTSLLSLSVHIFFGFRNASAVTLTCFKSSSEVIDGRVTFSIPFKINDWPLKRKKMVKSYFLRFLINSDEMLN